MKLLYSLLKIWNFSGCYITVLFSSVCLFSRFFKCFCFVFSASMVCSRLIEFVNCILHFHDIYMFLGQKMVSFFSLFFSLCIIIWRYQGFFNNKLYIFLQRFLLRVNQCCSCHTTQVDGVLPGRSNRQQSPAGPDNMRRNMRRCSL